MTVATFVHEAGHAVTAALYDVPIRSVTIYADLSGLTQLAGAVPTPFAGAAVAVAGEIAVQLYRDQGVDFDGNGGLHPPGLAGDNDGAKAYAWASKAVHPLEVSPWLEWVRVNTRRRLSNNLDAVDRIAQELERTGAMDGPLVWTHLTRKET